MALFTIGVLIGTLLGTIVTRIYINIKEETQK